MPRPLSSLTDTERSLLSDLPDRPLDRRTADLLADAAEDFGQHARAELLHRQPRLALMELFRGCALEEGECQAVLLEADAGALLRRYSEALGAPDPARGEAMLQLLQKDGTLNTERLREQYDFQRLLLASYDLLEEHNGQPGITGIDGSFHPLPSLAAIQQRLKTPALRRELEQGRSQLGLVPFGLPLRRLIEAWERGLLRNEHLLPENPAHSSAPRLDRTRPVRMWEERYGLRKGLGPDEDGRLVYGPQRFDPTTHGGRTKRQLLARSGSGWRVVLTDGRMQNIPASQPLAGRDPLVRGWFPNWYLTELQPGEREIPEDYIVDVLSRLERTGQLLDTETLTCLTGSYLPASDCVPHAAYCRLRHGQAVLGGDDPDCGGPSFGARAAVRVI